MALLSSGPESLVTPRDFVQSGWDYQRQLGDRWRDYAMTQLANLNAITITPMTFETPVDLQLEFGTFTRPTAPTRPTLPSVAVSMPAAPTLEAIPDPTIAEAPAEPDFTGLTYVRPAAPNRPAPTRPVTADIVLDAITVPDAPAFDMPDDPDLYQLNLPVVPDIVIPEFLATRPVRDFGAPGQTFAYAPAAYDRSHIDTIRARLADIFQDGLGLPPHIEDAIFDRARGREDMLAQKSVQEAEAMMAARGIRSAGGLLQRKVDQIRAEASRNASGVGRDIAIRQSEMAVEGIRFALTQSIGFETSLLQSHVQENELSLRAAEATQRVSVELFNARVALYNAEWEGFRSEAQAFEARIRAIQSEVEIYRAQVEAQKTLGDVNESLVRAFAERLRARNTLVEIYRAQVEAARVRGELNTQKLEQQRLTLEAFGQDVEAWGKEWDAHRINVDAELGNIRAYSEMANVWRARVDVWQNRNNAYFEQGRFRIQRQEQQLSRFRSELDAARTESQLRLGEMDGLLRAYSTDAQLYGVEGQISATESAAADRTVEQRIAAARLRIETAQNNLRLNADYAIKGIDALIAVKRGQADIVAQLAASSASGVNFSAGYSGGLSFSYGRSASWSGEAPDGPDF